MKLLVVTCLKDYLRDISALLRQANIAVFSSSDIIGHQEEGNTSPLDDWFAGGGEVSDSVMIFTFTSEENTLRALTLIKEYNQKQHEKFPVRANILPVERSL